MGWLSFRSDSLMANPGTSQIVYFTGPLDLRRLGIEMGNVGLATEPALVRLVKVSSTQSGGSGAVTAAYHDSQIHFAGYGVEEPFGDIGVSEVLGSWYITPNGARISLVPQLFLPYGESMCLEVTTSVTIDLIVNGLLQAVN
jgi:hypothetical protein